jgi:hypothetical protein
MDVWRQVLAKTPGMAADQARHYERLEIPSPGRLVVYFKAGYTFAKSICERPEQVSRFERTLAELAGGPVRIEFALAASPPDQSEPVAPVPPVLPHQRLVEVARHPLVRRAGELFGATPTDVLPPVETQADADRKRGT